MSIENVTIGDKTFKIIETQFESIIQGICQVCAKYKKLNECKLNLKNGDIKTGYICDDCCNDLTGGKFLNV